MLSSHFFHYVSTDVFPAFPDVSDEMKDEMKLSHSEKEIIRFQNKKLTRTVPHCILFPPNPSPPPGNRNMFLCWCGRLTVMGPWTFTPHLFRPRRVTQLQTKKPGLIPRLCASWWLKHWQPKSQPPLRGHRQVGVPDCLSYGSPPFRLDTLLCPAVWLAAWDLLSSV